LTPASISVFTPQTPLAALNLLLGQVGYRNFFIPQDIDIPIIKVNACAP
jgi:hypothetical protein